MTAREFEQIYRKLYLPLCMYALRLTEDTERAQDVVQTTFMRVWEVIRNGGVITRPETYMYRAVRNSALASIRSDNVFTTLPEETEKNGEVTLEEIDTAERDARLWKAIDDMPPRRREIFLMCRRDGMSYAAIAEELGLSVKTVENQLTKATATLRAQPQILNFLITFL
ncbi:MAG: RNA polymerase sigma-70 factor [Muribaculaceae bacterium]|nr:RNA polymerase sigma-70 factor [Muribaculaceae bacterium]